MMPLTIAGPVLRILEQNPGARKQIEATLREMMDEFSKDIQKNPEGVIAGIYDLMDERLRKLMKEDKDRITCKRGCSFCCHINVDITLPEALLIKHYCEKNKIPILRKHLEAQLQYDEKEVAFSPVSACVFLKDGECSIYEVRPVNCRKYLVTTPAQYCDAKYYKGTGHNGLIMLTETICELAALALLHLTIDRPGEAGRMPELLLPYAQ